MPREITKVTVEWSDGRRYQLSEDHIARLFQGNNPMSSYISIAFSPDLDGGGWVEEEHTGCELLSRKGGGTEAGLSQAPTEQSGRINVSEDVSCHELSR